MKSNNTFNIVFKSIAQFLGGFLLLTCGFLLLATFSGTWLKILWLVLYVIILVGYVFTIIEDLLQELTNNYRILVKNKADALKIRYPHLIFYGLTNSWSIKDCRRFLKTDETVWRCKEEEEITRLEEESRIDNCLSLIEMEAPHGIDSWLKIHNSYAYWRKDFTNDKNSDAQEVTPFQGQNYINKETLIQHKDEIYHLEDAFRVHNRINSWIDEQAMFNLKVKSLTKNGLSGFGYSYYPIPIEIQDEYGNGEKRICNILQLFAHSYCSEIDLDYTYFNDKINLFRYLINQPYSNNWEPPLLKFYDRLISKALLSLGDKDLVVVFYDEKPNHVVLKKFYESFPDSLDNINKIHPEELLFEYFRSECIRYLRQGGISLCNYSDLDSTLDLKHSKLVIITNQLLTNDIISLSQDIWARFPVEKPFLSFLSIFKDLNRSEMIALIQKKEKKIANEEEQRIKEQELIDSILTKVAAWDSLPSSNLKINYLFDYYPTTVEFEADDDEWGDRWTVWHFKNDPEKTPKKTHQRVLNRVIPEFVGILTDTFSEGTLKYLTLVCIPASTKEKNIARYKEFSERLCQETGIENGFEYVHLTRDRVAKREGGNADDASITNYSFDPEFFKGKRVILFDDIITKGNSMRNAKSMLEKEGAFVICGISIGKTRHERREDE